MNQDFKLDKKNIEYISDLTPLQEGILFHYLRETERNLYFVQLALDIEGVIDRDIFQRAWECVIAGNEMLRTVFRWDKLSKPLQIVLKENEGCFKYYDFTDRENQNSKIEKIKSEDYNEGFCLQNTPFRVTLCKFNKHKHTILISNHHIIFDGWSTGIVLKEFFYNYNALVHGDDLKISVKTKFKQFVPHNRIIEQDGLAFWRNYLSNFESNSVFKYWKISYCEDNGHFKTVVPCSKTERIKQNCQQHGFTITDLLYCSWGILLSKYSSSDDVVFGTTVSGRNIKLKGIEEMVGLFINTIPLRLHFPSGKTLIEQVKENGLQIQKRSEFENIPLPEILKHTGFKEEELFESILVIENYPLDKSILRETNALAVNSYSIKESTNYKLTISVILDTEIEIHFKYSKSDFGGFILENIANQYVRIIDSLVSDNPFDIQDIDILSREEKHQLIYAFNDTKKNYPKSLTIPRLLNEHVRKFKKEVAIKHGGELFRYSDLYLRVRQVSELLKSHGVVAGEIVAIEQYRSVDMIISIFGILQAGCVYLPIDPDYPIDRKSYIISDSGTKFILTHPGTEINYRDNITEIPINSLLSAPKNDEEPCNDTQGFEPCYIIYTSGSTGKPKGVQVCHSSVINLLYCLQEFYPINTSDSYLFKTSYCFDVSVSEIFGWILGGGSLAILGKGAEKDTEKIVTAIHGAKVSHVNFVPSMFKVFSDSLGNESVEKLLSLKYVIIAGEALHYDHIKNFTRFGLRASIENLYGPTEATVYASKYSVNQENNNEPILIGKGISNTNLYILDKYNQLQAVGVAGELCVSGGCLSMGYINNPELTKDKFIDHPFIVNDRLYKTGDLARWLPNGNIEFLGRMDHQVKVRGFRIELGEIERVLLNHEMIKEVVVVARGSVVDIILCAYYISEKDIDPTDLKEFLSIKLPDYMIPSFFMRIDCIPVTPNGKIDRKVLPDPKFIASDNFAVPKTDVEERLRKIWSEILIVNEKTISTSTSFFALGGHSLSVIRILNLVKREFSVSLTIDEIFNLRTIKRISKHIESKSKISYKKIHQKERKQYYELSSAQKRLYFLYEFDKKSLAYNLPLTVKLEGGLDKDKISDVFEQLIARHESLRTSFHLRDGKPVQLTHNEVLFKIEHFESTEEESLSIINNFIRPFDLCIPPLLHVGIIKLKSNEYILMIDMHHIITDGTSLGILTKEFMALYNDEALPKIRIQYKDYSEWHRGEAQQEETLKQRDFWINEFSEEIPALELPKDFIRPSIKSYEGGCVDFDLDIEETNRLKIIAESAGTTMFMILLSIYNILLSKLSNQEDIVIGIPIAGRQHSDLDNVIGMFVNTLPLRNYPNGEFSFNEFLSLLKSRTLACFKNQDYQYENLIDELKLERQTNRNPLFDVVFTFQNYNEPKLEIPGLTLKHYRNEHSVSKFDLSLSANEGIEKIFLSFEYSTSLFRKETIVRFIAYFKKIVSALLSDQNLKISDIEIISEDEKRQLLVEFNNTDVVYPKGKTIIDFFQVQTVRTPDKIALRFNDQHITYNELDKQSNKLALLLRDNGAKANEVVGLLMDRSIETVIGMLSIIKSGGAYLPIDINYPKERIEFILKDSGTKTLLTNRDLKNGIKSNAIKIYIEDSIKIPEKGETIDIVNSSSDLCYIIYTSGTTGNPKGVMVEHKNVVRLFYNDSFQFDFGSDDIWTMFHSHCFDFSVWEIYGALLFGGKLVIIPRMIAMDPLAYLKILKKDNVTILNQTPSAFYNLSREELLCSYKLLALRYVIFGGEALSPRKLKEWRVRYPNIKLVNMYGITETTVHVTYKEIGEYEINNNSCSIGKTIPTLSIYVFDKHQKLVPKGIIGELYVGGEGVTRGYLGNKELTDKKFITNPYNSNERLYRSGDLGRILSFGEIEYIGRIDHQIQLRGFRVELGEIESQLLSHEKIKEVVVIAKENENSKYLVAYYVSDVEIWVPELRSFLSAKLPDYMIPAYYVHLDHLPLTTNGKLNQKVLPEPEFKTVEQYVIPITKEEKLLAEVWSSVLCVKNIGTTDNFFTIGGDSIKSIQIISRMRDAGYEMSVKDIFTSQTIQKLALKIKEIVSVSDQVAVIGAISLTPIQSWFINNDNLYKHHFNQSVMLNFPKGITEDTVRLIFMKINEHHDALRIVFKKENGKILQQNEGINIPISLEIHDLNESKDPFNSILSISNKLQSEIDLEDGPLMRLGLFHLKDGTRLLIVIHHLVVDGISWRILLEDVENLYQQIERNEPLVLPLKTDSFQLWSENLLRYTKSKSFQMAKDYWDSISQKESSPIIRSNPNGNNTIEVSKNESFRLSKKETSQLLTEAHSAFNTQITDLLLTAFLISLNKKTGINTVKIDLEGHGREEIFNNVNISRTVGWFTSIYPVVLEKTENTLSGTIKQVKELLRRIPNKGIDYLIQKYLILNEFQGDTNVKITSQISFNYLGQFDFDIESKSFLIAHEPKGDNISLKRIRNYDWDISGMVIGGQLEMNLLYSKEQYKEETLCSLMNIYKESLVDVISYCCKYDKVELSPSDLTYKLLTINQLDELQCQYNLKDIYPLSPMQEGMLFHSLYEKEADHYFEQVSYQLNGKLQINAIEKSLRDLMARHDILRTVFLHDSYIQPIQLVLKEREIDFTFKDVQQECLEYSREKVIESYKTGDKSRTFDLSNDVLIRVTVLQTSIVEYEFIWSFHHIIMDGWCMSLIINDFTLIYSLNNNRKGINLPTTKPYSNYIEWLEKRDKDESLSYWSNYLTSYESLATLPEKTVKSSEVLPYNLNSQQLVVSEKETTQLQRVTEEYGVTISNILQSAWALLLAKYNNTEDVVFGSVVSGRPAELDGIETMIGLFINTIPVRVLISEKDTVGDLLKEVQNNALRAEQHHYSPLSEIQSLSELGRSLFNHIIVFENYPITDQLKGSNAHSNEGEDYTITNIRVFERTNYDLTLIVIPGTEIRIRIDYNTNVYAQDIIVKALGHIRKIVEQIISNSKLQISDIEIVTEEEKHQLLKELNIIDIGYPNDKTVHDLFKIQALKSPHRSAIRFKDQDITYQELDIRSNQLATMLREKGVKPDDIVGLLMDRSIEIIIGMLSIIKAGGAYLPIDINYPKDRKEFIISDSGIATILVTKNQGDNFENNITTLYVEDSENNYEHINALENVNKPSDLCYVIYTSGTTGNPKGVMVEHKNVVRLFYNDKFQFDFGLNDVWTMFHSHCFDFSVWEIYGALLFGGKLIIIPKLLAMDTVAYLKVLKEEKVTILNQTPSAFYNLSREEQLSPDVSLNLRYVIFGGEALSPAKLEPWRRRYPNVKLINMFGITETTVHVTYKELGEYEIAHNISSVGKPIPTLSVYILDKYQKLVPKGITGELYVGGAGVARGYLGKRELTGERFIQNPYDLEERLYRSGDLGRVLPSGDIEYLGRIDHQVKIRGFRIELGEIENALLRHENVKECIVIAKEDKGDKYLCAYVVCGKEFDKDELRSYLSAILPDYMVPSYYIVIEKLPLNSNGKIDLKSLPSLEYNAGSEYIAPSNEIEEKLVDIWSEILNLSPNIIGVNTNFFYLGGHSLKAMTLILKLNIEYNVKIKLVEIFNQPTIRGIAHVILNSIKDTHKTIHNVEKKEYYELSSAQKRIFVIQKMNGLTNIFNIPISFILNGKLKIDVLENSFKNIIKRHETLRTSFIIVDGKPVQKINKNIEFKIEFEQNFKGEIDQRIDHFIQPFNFSEPPLFRVLLLKIEEDKFILVFDIHHIISDGVTQEIIAKECLSFYDGIMIEEPTFQYKDYSEWQKSFYYKEEIKKQEKYWLNEYKILPPLIDLPSDFKRKEINKYQGSYIEWAISKNITNKTHEFIVKSGTTMFTVLLSVYYILIYKYSNIKDIVIGFPVTGRNEHSFANTIGMFVNMIAIRNKIDGNSSYNDFLKIVKKSVINALENQDYQFDELVNKLGLTGTVDRNPLFNIVLAMQNMEKSTRRNSDFEVTPYNISNTHAKFDLTLSVNEQDGELKMYLEYSTQLFLRNRIEQIQAHFTEILSQVVENDIKIDEINFSGVLPKIKSKNLVVDAVDFNF